MGLSFLNLYVNHRVLDLIFMFLIVWYYCTLTIRESILRVNGSKIKVKHCICLYFLIADELILTAVKYQVISYQKAIRRKNRQKYFYIARQANNFLFLKKNVG